MPVANLEFCEEEAKHRRDFFLPCPPPSFLLFPVRGPFPFLSPSFLSSLPLHFSRPFPSSRLRIGHRIQLRGMDSAVACEVPQRGPGRSLGRNGISMTLCSPRNVFGGNYMGSFCVEQNAVTEESRFLEAM